MQASSNSTNYDPALGRLEAFLNAFPGEYCGFAVDGSAAYSKGFCDALGLGSIRTIADIQAQLSPGDAAALESLFERLRRQGTPFSIPVQTHDDARRLKISGSQGQDLAGRARYYVLWIEPETRTDAQAAAPEIKNLEAELVRLRTALNTIPRPLWLRDAQQNIVWCNYSYADYTNTTPERAVSEQKELGAQEAKKKAGGAREDLLPGRDLARKALTEKTPFDSKAHAIFRGNRFLMKISEIPLADLGMTLGIAYNITREEELESTLKRHEASNKELLEHLRSAIGIYNTDQRLEFYNTAFAQLWGLEGGWLNTKPRLSDLMEKLREGRRLPEQSDFRKFKQSWLDMFTGLINPHEDMLYLPDGTALRMLVVPHSMGGLMMTFEDVTSRLELESSYNTLIAVQKETLDNLAEAVAVYGGDGRLKLWNPSFCRLWDLNPEDLEGEPHITALVAKKKKFFPETDWPQRREDLIAQGLERRMHEGRLIRVDESLVDFTTVPLPDGGVLVTYADVTDTVRVENALREKNAALETAEQLKLDFLANVSYQLRTPLNAIMGFTEILEQEYFGPLNERQKAYTRDMGEASQKLLGLINDILDLSTLEAGYMNLEREDIRIHDMMQGVLDLVSEWARKERIEVTLKCPKNIGSLVADQRRLQQALINLIRNAITFTQAGGQITLAARRLKTGIEISVTDTGIGISADDKVRIFEPFERAQSGSQQSRVTRGGAGLGLSLVKNIVALHGGTVALESEPGQGTHVTLFLPFLGEKTSLHLPVNKPAAEK